MEKLEDLLPGIEKFLRTTLAKESLSAFAENRRLSFVERLDILQLPPHLPPKPDGERMQIQGRKLPEPGKSKSNEDFIAHQRAISRQSLPRTGTQVTSEDNPVPNDGLGIDSDQYEEGLYEEPVPMENKFIDSQNYLPSSSAAIAALDNELDGDSSTSYESYDEPDVDGHYNNIGCDGQIKTDIPLPRLKPKKKKKSLSILERYYKQLLNVTQEGDVHHKTKGSWIRRYCALCDGIFYIYKDRESKPLYGLPLAGYDVILQEKEKGRSNVLRLAHPGCETHFLSTDSASEIQSWINKIEPLCSTASSDVANSQSNDRTGSISSMETYTDNALLNGSPTMKNRKVANTVSSDGKREKKGKIGKFLSETFGKKKGRSVSQQLEISEGALLDRHCLASPDISIAGLVKLSSPLLLNDDSWQYKYCAIRNGTFECFKDDSNSSDLDFSLPLTEYELGDSTSQGNNSLCLAIAKQGETAFVIEPENKIDQGDWLSALVKHVGTGGAHSAPERLNSYEDYTYVDNRDMLLAPSTSVEENSSITFEEGQISEDERQYADLSDREEDSSTGGGDPYDEPPTESGDRASKVYEEVSVPSNKPAALPNRQLSEPGQADTSDLPAAVDEKSDSVKPMKKPASEPTIATTNSYRSDQERKTRSDVQTKADIVSAPTSAADSAIPSFSRESSCSSEGGSRKLGETIAKSRAVFENNSSANGGAKWSGFKLAGAANPSVKRTPSLSSTTSTKSTPNSAASSPRTSRAASGNVDKFKATFEANNNSITDKQASQSPIHSQKADNSTRISPIRLSADEGSDSKPPPKFTAVFSSQTTVQVNNNKPRKFEIKSITPSGGSNVAEALKLGIDPTLRFDIDLSSKDKTVTLPSSDSRLRVTSTPKKSSTLPASSTTRTAVPNTSLSTSPNTSKVFAKSFLSSTLQKLAADESRIGSSHPVSTPASIAEDEKRLELLRQKLTALRKERKKIRDQKLSTVLPDDREKLNAEYNRIDTEYKSTNQEIVVLEDRKLQHIKETSNDSIDRRRQDNEKNSLLEKKKLWEAAS